MFERVSLCSKQHSKERVHGTIVVEKQRVSDKTEFILVERLVLKLLFEFNGLCRAENTALTKSCRTKRNFTKKCCKRTQKTRPHSQLSLTDFSGTSNRMFIFLRTKRCVMRNQHKNYIDCVQVPTTASDTV